MNRKDDEVRWEFGEAIMARHDKIPGLFMIMAVFVLSYKHLKRLSTRCAIGARHALYVRLHRWSARGLAANSNRPGAGDPG